MSDAAACSRLAAPAPVIAAEPGAAAAQALIGHALLQDGPLPAVSPACFPDELDRALWATIVQMRAEGKDTDAYTLCERLNRSGDAARLAAMVAGGNLLKHLVALQSDAPIGARPEAWAQVLADVAKEAEQRASLRAVADLLKGAADPGEAARAALKMLQPVADAGPVRGHALRAVRGGEFVQSFELVAPVLDAIPATGRGRLVAVTGPTGHGKTTLFTLVQMHVATGRRFAGRHTEKGRVLVLCGENPDDYNTHLIATMTDMGLQPGDLDNILVMPLRFDIEHELPAVAREVETFGELTAVFVDTSAAYFFGGDDNSNADQYAHASKLRMLATLPGKPLVIVLCHPIKNPSKDNLLPRGGSAFLNEVDANLTVWKDDATEVFSLHWAGKMRGPNFDPLRFELHKVEVPAYTDSRGRPLVSTVARFVPEERAEHLAEKAFNDQDVLLLTMLRNPNASVRTLAMKAGWTNEMGKPLKTRVERRLETLARHKLADRDRKGTWFLTAGGLKEAEGL